MPHSTHKQILSRIRGSGKGNIFFPVDFMDIASVTSVNKTLSRLNTEGVLERLGQGIYLFPKQDAELGTLYPSTEEIAIAIARRDKANIAPTGLYALQKLGLSTQMVMKTVYLTDGAPREIKIGNRSILFKKTVPRKLTVKSAVVQLVIQALTEIGKDGVTPEQTKKIYQALALESTEQVKKDATKAPAWIQKFLTNYINLPYHEELADTTPRKKT